jgi:flavin reductase (DIM6/NTAB) family NADH-FMN oxidoreductase RutF
VNIVHATVCAIDWMSVEIDPGMTVATDLYKVAIGAVQPRPIAWVSTCDDRGAANLAPFSFFTVASRSPLTIVVSVGKALEPKRVKDTLANVEATGEMVVNIGTSNLLVQLAASGAPFPADVDEFEVTGLTPVPSRTVRVPRVAEAPIAFECVVDRLVPVGEDTLVLGLVQWIHARDDVIDDRFHIDLDRLAPLSRMAGPVFNAHYEPVQLAEGDAVARLGDTEQSTSRSHR